MCKVSVCVTKESRNEPRARSPLCRPGSQPVLALGLALDEGFVWQLKWCPAGAWQPPGSGAEVSGVLIYFSCTSGQSLDTVLELRGVFSALSPRTCPDWASLLWPLPAAWSRSTACRTPMPCTPTGSRTTLVRLWFPFIFNDLNGRKVHSRPCSAFF